MERANQLVREKEPGALRYHLHVEMNGNKRGEDLVYIEK